MPTKIPDGLPNGDAGTEDKFIFRGMWSWHRQVNEDIHTENDLRVTS